MPLTSPDEGGPGLYAKPLDAVIGRVFAPYCPGGRQGSHSEKTRRKSTILAGRFAGRGGAPVQYRAHRPMEGVQGYNGSHWMPPPGEYCGR